MVTPRRCAHGTQNLLGLTARWACLNCRWGNWGFWVQLVTAVVSAVILAFSVAITGQATNAISAYLTAGGIVAAFISVFRSFGYTRLARQFEESADDPDRVSTLQPMHSKNCMHLLVRRVWYKW